MGTLIGALCLLLFFIFVKKGRTLFFKIAIIIVLLFFLNIILNGVGIMIPINVFTVVVIVVLRLPGVICIGLLLFLKFF